MQNLIFTLNTIAPVFLIVFLGVGLKRARMIDDHFIKVSSQIVFNVTLPALVFSEIATTNYSEVLHAGQIGFACAGVLVSCTLAWILSSFICQNGRDQGAFIQGSFRSNFSILGFALIYNAFGQTALANAAVLLAFIMPLLNILSVIVLAVPMHRENQINLRHTGLSLLKNPLILSAFAAIPFSYFQIHIPGMLIGTVKYLAAMTLPLALLGIGGSLSAESAKKEFRLSLVAALNKIVITPALMTFLAIKAGFAGYELGVLFFLFGPRPAIASYIRAEAMGSNSRLAATIILLSTLASVLTLSLGLFLLRHFNLA